MFGYFYIKRPILMSCHVCLHQHNISIMGRMPCALQYLYTEPKVDKINTGHNLVLDRDKAQVEKALSSELRRICT